MPEQTFVIFTSIGIGIFALFFAVRSRYRIARSTDPELTGDAIACCVCNTPQNPWRMQPCVNCKQWFCNYPTWVSPRRKFRNGIKLFLIILGFVGTAFSIVGGLIMVAMIIAALYVPYIILSQLFPGDTAPNYWKVCGGSYSDEKTPTGHFRCNNCGGAAHFYPSQAPHGYHETTVDDHYSSNDDSDDFHERFKDDDDDDDDRSGGSFWDGWLFKHGKDDD